MRVRLCDRGVDRGAEVGRLRSTRGWRRTRREGCGRGLVIGDPGGRSERLGGRGLSRIRRRSAIEILPEDLLRATAVAEAPHDPLVISERLAKATTSAATSTVLYPSRSTPGSPAGHDMPRSSRQRPSGAHSTGARPSSGRPTSGQEMSGSERPMPRWSRYTTGRGPPGHFVSGDSAIDDVSPPGPPGRKIIGSHRPARRWRRHRDPQLDRPAAQDRRGARAPRGMSTWSGRATRACHRADRRAAAGGEAVVDGAWGTSSRWRTSRRRCMPRARRRPRATQPPPSSTPRRHHGPPK